ncbi:transcriptional regulator [Polaromonas sp. CG_9.5]|uniref:FMN-binding negative transcriptional regulator n=1 Tax=Polaromonas sp. CG_9.5 TaxID=3071705 RepID=UPI002E01BAAB|nr:transcriptional regulator [Polaromonas sp. CG_9.5]
MTSRLRLLRAPHNFNQQATPMYCPTHFEEQRSDVLLDLIAQHPLATIVTQSNGGLVADHIPLLYQKNGDLPGTLIGHVAKNNPLWQAASEHEHLLIFQGASSYISPNLYATKAESGKVVPTWNYAVVHAHATLTATQNPEAILRILTGLTNRHESSQEHPWQVTDAPPDFTQNLLNSIVGIEFHIKRLTGKWKVSQNQPQKNQQSVIGGLRASGSLDTAKMAELVAQFGADLRK